MKFWSGAFWQPKKVEFDDLGIPAPGERLSGRQERRLRRFAQAVQEGRATEKYALAATTEVERGGGASNAIMYSVATGLVALQIGMAAFSGPIYSFATGAATNMMDRDSYVTAVLGEDGRGEGTSKLPPLRPPWENLNPTPPLLPVAPALPEIVGSDAS